MQTLPMLCASSATFLATESVLIEVSVRVILGTETRAKPEAVEMGKLLLRQSSTLMKETQSLLGELDNHGRISHIVLFVTLIFLSCKHRRLCLPRRT